MNWLFNCRSGKADLPTNKQTIIDKNRKAYNGLGLTNLCLTRVVSERRFFFKTTPEQEAYRLNVCSM